MANKLKHANTNDETKSIANVEKGERKKNKTNRKWTKKGRNEKKKKKNGERGRG